MMTPNEADRSDHPQDPGVAFEVARDILGRLLGHASDQIRRETDREIPDPATVEQWQRRREEWTSRWHSLRATDTAAVQAVLDRDGAVLRSLRTD
jgi:hypothetical protein